MYMIIDSEQGRVNVIIVMFVQIHNSSELVIYL